MPEDWGWLQFIFIFPHLEPATNRVVDFHIDMLIFSHQPLNDSSSHVEDVFQILRWLDMYKFSINNGKICYESAFFEKSTQ